MLVHFESQFFLMMVMTEREDTTNRLLHLTKKHQLKFSPERALQASNQVRVCMYTTSLKVFLSSLLLAHTFIHLAHASNTRLGSYGLCANL